MTLRPWEPADRPALVAAWSDDQIAAASAVPGDISLEAAGEWIAGAATRFDQRVAVDFVVECDGNIVGEVGLGPIDLGRRAAYVGYWVFADYRGGGVATAALARLIGWVIDGGEFDVLLARTTVDNAASTRVLERNGFAALRNSPGMWARHIFDTHPADQVR